MYTNFKYCTQYMPFIYKKENIYKYFGVLFSTAFFPQSGRVNISTPESVINTVCSN